MPDSDTATETVQRLFVDEAGDPTLFQGRGKVIVDTPGCSRFFIIGKLDVDDPPALADPVERLRAELLSDPYFGGVESFRPERKKTALLFHARDDVPKVRYRVLCLLRRAGETLRFHGRLGGSRSAGCCPSCAPGPRASPSPDPRRHLLFLPPLTWRPPAASWIACPTAIELTGVLSPGDRG